MSKFDNRPKRAIEQGKDIFFTPSDNEKQQESKPASSGNIDFDEKVRQTYYVTEQQRKALALMAAHEDLDKSEIVRAALNAYIPQSYMRMVLMK